MRIIKSVLIKGCILITFVTSAFADLPGKVLMVDLNLSFTEEEHAAKAAQARGDEIEIIPTLTQQQKNTIKPIRAQLNQLEEKTHCLREKSAEQCGLKKNETVESLNDEFSKTKKQIQAMVSEYDPRFKQIINSLTQDKQSSQNAVLEVLKSQLKNISKGAKPLNGLIISGHSGALGFSGFLGSITKSDMNELTQDPEANKSIQEVKDLLLWGCYSTTIRSIKDYLGFFPNVRLVAGFEGRGPKEDKAGDWQYLEAMLKNSKLLSEKASLDIEDKNKKTALLNTLSSYNNVINQMHTSFYVKGACSTDQYLFHKKGNDTKGSFEKFDDLLETCYQKNGEDSIEVSKLLSSYNEIILKYGVCLKNFSSDEFKNSTANQDSGRFELGLQKAINYTVKEKGLEHIDSTCSVPDSSSGEIKKLYDDMNKLSYCDNKSLKDIFPSEGINESLNSVLFLRLFGVFMDNWYNKYGAFVDQYNKEHPEAPIKITKTSNRGQVVQEITKYFEQNKPKASTAPPTLPNQQPDQQAGQQPGQQNDNKLSQEDIQKMIEQQRLLEKDPKFMLNKSLRGLLSLFDPEYTTDWAIPGGVQ